MCHSWKLVENCLTDYHMDFIINLFFNPGGNIIYTLFKWVIVEKMLADFFSFVKCIDFVSCGNIEYNPIT